jgi:signal transduction histidine kinase
MMVERTGLAAELVDGALRALLEAVDEALMLVDEHGRLLAANARLWLMFDIEPTGDLAAVRSSILGCVRDPEAYFRLIHDQADGREVEIDLVRPEPRVVRRRVAALRDPDGRRNGWLVSYRDVTRDAETNRLKTEWVSNVSHELRTPMAAIKGFLGVVLDDEETLEPEQRRKFLGIARAETDRLSRLIDDLLDISRIEAGRRPRHETSFAVAELLYDAVLLARPQAEAGGLKIELEAPPPAWRLTADRDQLSQVLHNLVGNAVKFTAPGGRVRLWAEAREGQMRLAVADTGCGLAPEDLPHVFDKFYRGRAAGTRPRGTGLGLAIARELTEAHGGQIDITSRLGEGSVFVVRLPWDGEGL